jgi:two-component system chemotaxis response regulator CheB
VLPVQPKKNVYNIVAIGASAGGVAAVSELLSLLPGDLAAAVLVVVHRDPDRRSHLQNILTRKCQLKVAVPRQGDRLEYGVCFVGTPDQHLTVAPGLHVHLMPGHFYRGHNIDALFNSLARSAANRAIGLVLSGMLKDGTQGLKAIKESGGMAFVQSPKEAAYPDMPENAVRHGGTIDLIAPVAELAKTLVKIAGRTKLFASEPANVAAGNRTQAAGAPRLTWINARGAPLSRS